MERSKQEKKFVPTVRFDEQTPEVLITRKPFDLLYEKTFLTPEREEDSEFSRNTTTWD